MPRPTPRLYLATPPRGLDVSPFLGAAAAALALDALRAALIFGTATAVLMVILVVVSGQSAEHVLIGLGVAFAWGLAAWRVESTAALIARPVVVFVLVLAHAAVIAFDGGVDSPMATVAWACVALAVVVSPPRAGAAWLLVSVLGYLAALWVTGLTPREWIRGDAVASVSERVLGFILIAGAVLAALISIRRILWNSPELHGLFRPVAASSAAAAVGTLTDIELRVIRSLADGCTVAQIASETNYAETTIHGFVASAKKKIGARSRPQLVVIVIGTTVPRR